MLDLILEGSQRLCDCLALLGFLAVFLGGDSLVHVVDGARLVRVFALISDTALLKGE